MFYEEYKETAILRLSIEDTTFTHNHDTVPNWLTPWNTVLEILMQTVPDLRK
jgi:hypothetical protein